MNLVPRPAPRLPTRRTVLAGAAALAGLALGVPASAAPAPVTLRRGVNTWPWFSLTREYPAPRTDYAWPPYQEGRPVPRPEDLARLRRSGLDFVRIPVDPGPFLSFTGAQRRDLLDGLDAAVAQALGADLGVVVNIQASGTHYWTPERMTGSTRAPAFDAYLALVGDVAGRLARTDPDRVALEPINEPQQACTAAEWPPVQTALLGAARAAAPALTLVATGACGSMIPGLQALDPAPVLAFGRVLFTFHFYEPYLFTHQGAPWMREPVYRSLNAVPWPASAGSLEETLAAVRRRMAADSETPEAAKRSAYEETERVLKVYFDAQPDVPYLERYFAMMRDWAAGHGIPTSQILLGEFGALRSDARYVAAGAADRARYVGDVRRTAEAVGFPWAFWNMFDGMGLMEDDTRAFDPAIMDALGLQA